MRIVHTIAGLFVDTGGPAESVPGLCAALARRGHEVILVTGEGPHAETVARLSSVVEVVTAPLGPYWAGNYSAKFAALVRHRALNADVLHTHGMWLHPNFTTSRAGDTLGRPVVVSPRGMMSEWSMAHNGWRKRAAWWTLQKMCLSHAKAIHVTSLAEREDVRRAGLTTPTALIPNGLDLEAFDSQRIEALRRGGRERFIVFVSRIHPKKGLDVLVEAWKRRVTINPDERLIIAGPGETRYVEELRRVLSCDGAEQIEYVGPVAGDAKLALLSRARAVVLPSRNENYGMVVAEALACGTPVITTDGVPWPEIERLRCGWRIPLEVESLRDVLDEAFSQDDDELDAMGKRGRVHIEMQHSTRLAAERMEAVYNWMCGNGERPGLLE